MTHPSRSAFSLRNNDTMPRGPSGTRPATGDDNTADGRAGTEQGAVAVASYPDYATAQRAVDFVTSTPTLQADHYTLIVDADVAEQSREMLSRLPTEPRG